MGGECIRILFAIECRGRVFWFALPEFTTGRAGRVAVVGGGAEGLLALAVADHEEFDGDGEEEEDTMNPLISISQYFLYI